MRWRGCGEWSREGGREVESRVEWEVGGGSGEWEMWSCWEWRGVEYKWREGQGPGAKNRVSTCPRQGILSMGQV